MRGISFRLAMLLAAAAMVPLLVYGGISVLLLRGGMRQSAMDGNLNVALRAAEQIHVYMATNVEILLALSGDLESTGLTAQQTDRILKNYVIRFAEFRELTLFDGAGLPVVSSRIGKPRLTLPGRDATGFDSVLMSPIRVDDDLLPTTVIALPVRDGIKPVGWLAGELSTEQLWRIVDRIRIGSRGVAIVIGPDGRLLAHGDPDQKRLIAKGERFVDPLLAGLTRGKEGSTVAEMKLDGTPTLAAAARIPALDWTIIVAQPTAEAYGLARRLERLLFFAIAAGLLVTIGVGYAWGRSFIRPILALMNATRALAEGRLQERVHIDKSDELGQLGEAFNSMADRLVQAKEEVRLAERQALFGRISAGLVHDLSHPVKNIRNNCKLILRMPEDEEYRETFKRTIEREFRAIGRVLDDLRNLGSPMPLERFPLDLNHLIREVVESMRPEAAKVAVALRNDLAGAAVTIDGDHFALGRVYRNLIANAIEATPPGGEVVVTTRTNGTLVSSEVSDTGCGIPASRLSTIFQDFVTTKRTGLGLGLAIAKKIVNQLAGEISVESEVGRGTVFRVTFPGSSGESQRIAAAR
jgi:signal transduction histidine kinase